MLALIAGTVRLLLFATQAALTGVVFGIWVR